MKRVVIDFETRSELDVRDVGPYLYSIHPTTEIICLAYEIDGKIDIWKPDITSLSKSQIPFELQFKLSHNKYRLEAYNVYFERCIWENICCKQYNWPNYGNDIWYCSAAKAAYFALPRALEKVAMVLNLKNQKDMRGHRIMLKLTKPRKPTKNNKAKWHCGEDDVSKCYEYCKQDVRTEKELSSMLPDLPPLERKIWQLDQTINHRGVYCDKEAIESALSIIGELEQKAKSKIREISNGKLKSYGQVKEMLDYCSNKGVKLEDLTKNTLDNLNYKNMPIDVKHILQIRKLMGLSSTKKYQSMHGRICPDGRIRSLLVYHGASTGRWAGSGIQIQNFPKGETGFDVEKAIEDIKQRNLGEYKNKLKVLSNCLRGMLCAPNGKTLIAADYNAIEARVLFWLCDERKGLDAYHKGRDLYIEMATRIYNKSASKITKDERFVAKQTVLGCGYQMGYKKFMKHCETLGQKVSAEMAQYAIQTYRSEFNNIPAFWRNINGAAISCVMTNKEIRCGKISFFTDRSFLFCKLPSGRNLAYYEPSISIDEKYQTNKLNYYGMNSQNHQWEKIHTFGGKLTENVVQAISRDLLANAMLNIERAGFPIVLSVHDEIVCEVDPEKADIGKFEKLMCQLPEWANGLPVKAEGWKGKRFRK